MDELYLSQLIEHLQKILQSHGDLLVRWSGEYSGAVDLDEIVVLTDEAKKEYVGILAG